MRDATRDSARFNLGDMTRTFKVPTLPLVVVHPLRASRFKLTVRDARGGRDVGRREVASASRSVPH
jgi:hypothetical protein